MCGYQRARAGRKSHQLTLAQDEDLFGTVGTERDPEVLQDLLRRTTRVERVDAPVEEIAVVVLLAARPPRSTDFSKRVTEQPARAR
jgi:hypothetical protein